MITSSFNIHIYTSLANMHDSYIIMITILIIIITTSCITLGRQRAAYTQSDQVWNAVNDAITFMFVDNGAMAYLSPTGCMNRKLNSSYSIIIIYRLRSSSSTMTIIMIIIIYYNHYHHHQLWSSSSSPSLLSSMYYYHHHHHLCTRIISRYQIYP